jgi:hypothetical protein
MFDPFRVVGPELVETPKPVRQRAATELRGQSIEVSVQPGQEPLAVCFVIRR